MSEELLDIRTLSVVTVLFCGNYGAGLIAYSAFGRRHPGINSIGWGFVGSSVGFLLIALRGSLPDSLSIVAANGLIVAGSLLAYHGARRFQSKRSHVVMIGSITMAIYLATFIPLTYTAPDLRLRIVVISLLLAITGALCGQPLLRDPGSKPDARHVLAASPFLGYSAFSLFRAVWTYGEFSGSDFLNAGFVQALAVLGWVLQILLVTFGILWIATNRLEVELIRQARIDPLTDLLNRRALEEMAVREIARSDRSSAPLSVIMLDIDHFKMLNDRMGHLAGDTVLNRIAASLSSELRTQDVIARYGGEEFLIILPDTGNEQAYALAERLRRTVESIRIETVAGPAEVTVSAGVATKRGADESWEPFVHRADAALYRAKMDGRNLVR